MPFSLPIKGQLISLTRHPRYLLADSDHDSSHAATSSGGGARDDAGDKDVSIGGGADVIRQALAAGVVDSLVISTAPVILGAGKRLFDGFEKDVDLRIRDVHPSEWAVHTTYDVVR